MEEKTTYYNKQIKPTKKELVSIISKADEYNFESDNEKEENILNKKENINNIKSENSNDNKEEIQNLNEKYKFIIGNINWNDISLTSTKIKKLIYQNIGYYKSTIDYKNFAYFTCDNKKKNQKNFLIKECAILILN